MRNAVRILSRALSLRCGYAGGTVYAADGAAVCAELLRGRPTADGEHIEAYHRALSAYLGVPHVFTYGAGRMALFALLDAMGLSEDDEILLPGYNCVVIPNAIRFAGLRPVYADIREHDFNMDPELAERAITRRTRAIVVQHTFGIPCDMDAFLDLSQRKGLPLIEDCAHALGGTWDGRQLGTIGYAGFYSTEATKMFSTEKGGILVTRDTRLAARLRESYSSIPWRPRPYEKRMTWRFALRCLTGDPFWNIPLTFMVLADAGLRLRRIQRVLSYDRDDYRAELVGQRCSPYPCRLGNLMALAGLRQLRRLERSLEHRRRLARELEKILPPRGARPATYDALRAQPSWVRFPFLVEDRDLWSRRIAACGLEPGGWLNDPIHPAGCNQAFAMYRQGSCPVAERVAAHIVNVPVHSRVSLARILKLGLTDWPNACDDERAPGFRGATESAFSGVCSV